MPLIKSDEYCGKFLSALFIRRALTTSGARVGSCSKRSAAAPLTIGVAMLVPLRVKYAGEDKRLPPYVIGDTSFCGHFKSSVLFGWSSDAMRFPGATRSGLTT